jgi:hypothetical protein
MDVGVVDLALTLTSLETWGRDDTADVTMPVYY